MKKQALILSAAAVTVAQNPAVTTATFTSCEPLVGPTLTSTGIITVTFCPICSETSGVGPGGTTWATTYETVYSSWCPTGAAPHTWTVTESCTGPVPTYHPGTPAPPPGYTSVYESCTVCEQPTSGWMTYPTSLPAGFPTGSPCPPPTGAPVPPVPVPCYGPECESSAPPTGCSGEDCAPPAASPTECTGEGCAPPSAPSTPPYSPPYTPPTGCTGEGCSPESPPESPPSSPAPPMECTGEGCPGTSTPPAEECSGEGCPATSAPPAEGCSGPGCPGSGSLTNSTLCPGPYCVSGGNGTITPPSYTGAAARASFQWATTGFSVLAIAAAAALL